MTENLVDPKTEQLPAKRGPGRPPGKPKQYIREMLESDAFRLALTSLPKHLSADRFIRVALTAIQRTPKLMQCTKASLWKCMMDLSTFGLEPDGRRAHLIPYDDECTLIIDYKGLVELIRRTGDISYIHADVVGKHDLFEYQHGTDAKLVHKPALNDRGEIYAAYSFIRLKDGSETFDVMGLDEINRIKALSKAVQQKKLESPWFTHENEMRKKTVFRRHSKWQPLSSDVMRAMEYDDEVEPIPGKGFEAAKPVFDTSFLGAEDDPVDPEKAGFEEQGTHI